MPDFNLIGIFDSNSYDSISESSRINPSGLDGRDMRSMNTFTLESWSFWFIVCYVSY